MRVNCVSWNKHVNIVVKYNTLILYMEYVLNGSIVHLLPFQKPQFGNTFDSCWSNY